MSRPTYTKQFTCIVLLLPRSGTVSRPTVKSIHFTKDRIDREDLETGNGTIYKGLSTVRYPSETVTFTFVRFTRHTIFLLSSVLPPFITRSRTDDDRD